MKRITLLEGPIGTTLFRMGFPMFLGMLSMVVFNLTDTYYISRLGTEPLSAIGFVHPVLMIVASLSMSLATGISVTVSRYIGRGSRLDASRISTHGIGIALGTALTLSVLGLSTVNPLFRLLGASPEVLPLIKEYIEVWYGGIVFLMVPIAGNSAVRATGNTRFPALIMSIAAFLNLVLDPLFIFGPGPFPAFGIRGAAIATVLARFTATLASLSYLYFRLGLIQIRLPRSGALFRSFREISHIALPSLVSHLFNPLAQSIVIAMIARYGTETVAGYGLALKWEVPSLMVLISLASVLSPFVGQNEGAGQRGRIRSAMVRSYLFSLAWGGVLTLFFYLLTPDLVRFFTKEPRVMGTVVRYFLWVSVSYGFHGMVLLSTSALNALRRPYEAMLLTGVRLFVLYLPLALLGSRLFERGWEGIFAAYGAANLGAGAAAFLLVRRAIQEKG